MVPSRSLTCEISILGFSEIQWPSFGTQNPEHMYIYYSGGKVDHYKRGIAILMTSAIAEFVVEFLPVKAQAILIKLKTSQRLLNIIQVYKPTSEKPDENVENNKMR